MPEQPEDQSRQGHPDLEALLRRLARQVDVPAQPEYANLVRQQLDRDVRSRRRLGPLQNLCAVAAAVALLIVLAIVLGVPATRQAVADLFGISGVGVHPMPTSGPSPRNTLDANLDLGEPVTLAEAQRRVSFTVSVPSTPGLGMPDAVYVRGVPGLEAVNLLYRPRPSFPAGYDTHVGLLLSEYAGAAKPYFKKYVDANIPLTRGPRCRPVAGAVLPGRSRGVCQEPE